MREGMPPDYYRRGQDFQTQRAKNRVKGVESTNYADCACGGPKPADVFSGNKRTLEGKVTSAKITQQPSNQDRYGANREAIRKIKPFGRPIG